VGSRKPRKQKFNTRGEVSHRTHGGKVRYGKINLRDLVDSVELPTRPAQPWSDAETYRRHQGSFESGHLQLYLKCQRCGLEFVILTLRKEIEALEAYQPSHGEHGGICTKITCPECNECGSSALLGRKQQARPILEFAGRYCVKPPQEDGGRNE